MPKTRSSYGSLPNFVPGEITKSNIGVLEFDEILSYKPHVILKMNTQYQTELESVVSVCSSIDQSLWIKSGTVGLVQNIKPDGTKLYILSSYNTKVSDLDITQSNNLLISTGQSRIKQISSNTGTLTDSLYNVSPLLSTAIHITSDNKVLIGGINKVFPKPGRRVVILMNQNGDHERVYEHDQHKEPIFAYPLRLTRTRNGNIHVVDGVSADRRKVVVLGQNGDIINIYTGDTDINKERPFKPGDIVTTPRDNVIVADRGTNTLHILNNAGLLMTYYKTSDINIMLPLSLAFSPTGQLLTGYSRPINNTAKDVKIYKVTILGC